MGQFTQLCDPWFERGRDGRVYTREGAQNTIIHCRAIALIHVTSFVISSQEQVTSRRPEQAVRSRTWFAVGQQESF